MFLLGGVLPPHPSAGNWDLKDCSTFYNISAPLSHTGYTSKKGFTHMHIIVKTHTMLCMCIRVYISITVHSFSLSEWINVNILLIFNLLIFKHCTPKTPCTPLMFWLHVVRAQPCFNAANLFLLYGTFLLHGVSVFSDHTVGKYECMLYTDGCNMRSDVPTLQKCIYMIKNDLL